MEESRTIRCLGRQARVPVSYRLQRKPDGACSRRDSTSFGCRAPSRRRALLAPARARWSSEERSRRTALRLIENAVPAEEAQRRASELLGNEGISLLDKAARKVGMSQAGR